MNAGYDDDVIELPSRSRPGRFHRVTVNVLTNKPSGCSCEAWANGRRCWAMNEVAAEECSYRLQRCAEEDCTAILRIGHWRTGSDQVIDIFVCPLFPDHSRREPAVARMTRPELLAAA